MYEAPIGCPESGPYTVQSLCHWQARTSYTSLSSVRRIPLKFEVVLETNGLQPIRHSFLNVSLIV